MSEDKMDFDRIFISSAFLFMMFSGSISKVVAAPHSEKHADSKHSSRKQGNVVMIPDCPAPFKTGREDETAKAGNKEAASYASPADIKSKIKCATNRILAVKKAEAKYYGLLGWRWYRDIGWPPCHWQNPEPNYWDDPVYELGVIEGDTNLELESLQKLYTLYWFFRHNSKYKVLPPLTIKAGSVTVQGLSEGDFAQVLSSSFFDELTELHKAEDQQVEINKALAQYKPVLDEIPYPAPWGHDYFEFIRQEHEQLDHDKAKLWIRYSYHWLKQHPHEGQAPNLVLKTKSGTNIVLKAN